MILTKIELRESLKRVISLIDAIGFRDDIPFKSYLRLLKVEIFLHHLAYATLVNKPIELTHKKEGLYNEL